MTKSASKIPRRFEETAEAFSPHEAPGAKGFAPAISPHSTKFWGSFCETSTAIINHHQPSSTINHQSSSISINHHQSSSTINHHQPSIINPKPSQPQRRGLEDSVAVAGGFGTFGMPDHQAWNGRVQLESKNAELPQWLL